MHEEAIAPGFGSVLGQDYAAYGKPINSTGAASAQPLPASYQAGYTARDYDEISSLQWNRARWYDLVLGQWLSNDPIEGTTLRRNLREERAVKEVLSRPSAGQQLPLRMTDTRWPSSQGWVKMQQIVQSGGREGPINVHYVFNTITGAIDDLKIVLPGIR